MKTLNGKTFASTIGMSRILGVIPANAIGSMSGSSHCGQSDWPKDDRQTWMSTSVNPASGQM
jgi:hypothetical protein